MSSDKDLREEAWNANMELFRSGLVVHTFGNVSAFDRERGVFCIKPSGMPYDQLQPDQMVIVDLENQVVSGRLRPSSDTSTHTILYRYFSGIGGICHTHSTYACAWAQAVQAIPIFGTTHADFLTTDIPCTEVMSDRMIKGDYELETGNLIHQTFKDISFQEVEMVLVACHGPFTWGESAKKAVVNSVMLEKIAKTAFLTLEINPETPRLKKTLIEKHFFRKHGKDAYYGQKD